MERGSITGSMEYFENADQSPLWDGAPARGHLPVQVARALIDVLRRHTATPDDCWFGIWHGHASIWHGHGSVVADRPTLALPAREQWLVRGPIALAAENMAEEPAEQSANLWWPADRAWCVATDIDLVTRTWAAVRGASPTCCPPPAWRPHRFRPTSSSPGTPTPSTRSPPTDRADILRRCISSSFASRPPSAP